MMLSAILAHRGTQLTTVERQTTSGVDRAVLICIAILQTGIAALFLGMQFLIAFGGGLTLLTPLWLFGVVTGISLRPQFWKRMLSAGWHGVAGVFTLWSGFLLWSGASGTSLIVIGLYLVIVAFYLMTSALKHRTEGTEPRSENP
jgi:hypothetical protein